MSDVWTGPVKKAPALFDDAVDDAVVSTAVPPVVVEGSSTVMDKPWELIDDLVEAIWADIEAHRAMEDMFRNKKFEEARQHLIRASKLLRGE